MHFSKIGVKPKPIPPFFGELGLIKVVSEVSFGQFRSNFVYPKTADSQQMYLTVYKALYNYKLTFWWNILKIYFSDISLTFSLSFAEKNFKMAIALLLYNKTINNFMLDKILMISKLINYMFPIGCIQYQQIRIFSNSDTSGCVF